MAVKADITIDIDKQVGELQNLSQIYNARVGDDKTPLTIAWRKNDLPLNLKGLHAFIVGKTGDGSYNNETGKIDFPVGSPVTQFEDDGSGTLDGGQSGLTTLLIPKQMWQKSGIFAGYIGLKSEDGSVFTSKDIWFKVLGNVLDAGVEINYFIGDFNKALAEAEKKLQDKEASFDQATANALQNLHDKYLQKTQQSEDGLNNTNAAIENDLEALKRIAASVGALQAQLDADDLETNSDHKADIAAIKDEIGFRFSQIKHPVQAFDSLAQIQAKFPAGADGDMLAVDTGHIYIYQWDSNQWKDCGVYQSQGLSQADQVGIDNALKSTGFTTYPTKAPYNDLDTLPANTILTYPSFDGVKNVPEVLKYESDFAGFTITTYNYHSGTTDGGAVQVLHTNNNQRFWRVKWGTNPYGKWNNPMTSDFDIIFSNSLKPPFDNCDNLPDNTLIVYAEGLNQVKNSPQDVDHGAVLTINLRQDKYGKFQLLYLENQTYLRMWWGANIVPQGWQLLTQKSIVKQPIMINGEPFPEQYHDLNKLPVNQVVTYANKGNGVKNYPPNLSEATIITYGTGDNGSNVGEVQIAVDWKGNFAYRICWFTDDRFTPWNTLAYQPKPSLALFRSIGIIGDSYASGELAFDDHFTDHYNMSWGQILARKNGLKAINFSRGGQTTRGWLTDTERGLGLLNKVDAQDLYIIALGINDYQKLGDSYLGSDTDIDNGADTYYGNYGKIIKAIQTKAPMAKIVIATLSQTDAMAVKYNSAIQKIAKHFNLPCVTLNDDSFFTSDLYLNHMYGGHPTGPVYAEMANAYERLISKAMVDHLDYFESYEKDLATDNANDLSRITNVEK